MKTALYRLLLLSVLFAPPCLADDPDQQPRIAIIIDDLGDQLLAGERTIQLPGPVAVSILPHTPYAISLARAANARNKEVLLHLPLESNSQLRAGPGVMQLDMDRKLFGITLSMNLGALPYLSGLNNHMGSRLTRYPRQMNWLMESLSGRGLFFVDSMTTPDSVAYQVASERGVPTARRQVFLDDNRDPAEIRYQFERLVKLAKRRGFAMAIGHPYLETLTVLEQVLPELEEYGVQLVSVAVIVNLDEEHRSRFAGGEQVAAY